MTLPQILRLVRIMQADPRLGILQGLVVGLPSTSAFARIFQFGMRLRMLAYTVGAAWWLGGNGPYWGHNAVVRLAPFIAHCALPVLPGSGPLSGHVLSHDQIEAILMRRAGYDVRVLPEEDLGWEENPPTLLEFIRRDLRWCQGNMQYWHFFGLENLSTMARYQIAFALIWFLGSPAWIGMFAAMTAGMALAASPGLLTSAPGWLLGTMLVMYDAPKFITIARVLMRPKLRRAFGGTMRFLASVVAETVFSLMLSPIMWFGHTIFLARLALGHGIGWIGQTRHDHAVPWRLATARLWPQTVAGLTGLGILAVTAPRALPLAFIVAGGGLALSIPLAVVTARPRLGRALCRIGIGRLPEETEQPPELRQLSLAALALAAGADPAPDAD
jgi:membrane glycosyltransferase